jgi:hypothetical protein
MMHLFHELKPTTPSSLSILDHQRNCKDITSLIAKFTGRPSSHDSRAGRKKMPMNTHSDIVLSHLSETKKGIPHGR